MHINGQPFSNKFKVFAWNVNASSNQFNCRCKKRKAKNRKQSKIMRLIYFFFLLYFFHVTWKKKKKNHFHPVHHNHRKQSIIYCKFSWRFPICLVRFIDILYFAKKKIIQLCIHFQGIIDGRHSREKCHFNTIFGNWNASNVL